MKRVFSLLLVLMIVAASFLDNAKFPTFDLDVSKDQRYSDLVADSEVVTLPNGMALRGGIVKDGVSAFLGIPFAKAPVGALRWKPPQELNKDDISHDVMNVTKIWTYVYSKGRGTGGLLYLNVYANLDVSLKEGGWCPCGSMGAWRCIPTG